MIKRIDLEGFKERMEGAELSVPIRQIRNHMNWVGIEMISEDGTDFLQGFALMEIYRTKKGNCGKIHYIWVDPHCRNIGFGKALTDNMERVANEMLQENGDDPLYIIITNVNGDADACCSMLKSCGYNVEESGGKITADKGM